MKNRLTTLRYTLALLIWMLGCPSSALAMVNLVYAQVGNDVVLTASGGYENLNGLTYTPPPSESGGYIGSNTAINPSVSSAYLYSGSDAPVNDRVISVSGYTVSLIDGGAAASSNTNTGYKAATGEITGTGSFLTQINSSGTPTLSLAYDNANNMMYTSVAYSGTATWGNFSLADLGLAVGSHEIRWDSGNEGINITVVPEPSAFAAVASLFALGLVVCRRHRK